MSLVAYAASSDEDSDTSNNEIEDRNTSPAQNRLNGNISDDDEYDVPIRVTEKTQVPAPPIRKFLSLPAPSVSQDDAKEIEVAAAVMPSFDKLPKPKISDLAANEVIEADDEFLHKKETAPTSEKPPPLVITKGPVRITIPSLADFKDLEVSKKLSTKPGPSAASRPSGLLGLLPRPKQELQFTKSNEKSDTAQSVKSVTSLIPDSVKNQAAKKSIKTNLKNPLKPQPKKPLVTVSDSDESDNEDGDFFSLNSEHQLPEVSANEINAMVAKKAAQMAQTTSKIDELLNKPTENDAANEAAAVYEMQPTTSQEVEFDDRAMHALVGSRGKRRKIDEVNIVELSSNQVLPDKDEWLRSALASATSFQAMGVLTDEEPAPGTRKKHQITYLAHQAKANEQELQAMWSANRHTRRQTQGKYGF